MNGTIRHVSFRIVRASKLSAVIALTVTVFLILRTLGNCTLIFAIGRPNFIIQNYALIIMI